MTEKEDTM